MLTAAPAEVGPLPVLAKELMKKLRAARALADAAAVALDPPVPAAEEVPDGAELTGATAVPFVVAAVTTPPGALVREVPEGVAPVSDT